MAFIFAAIGMIALASAVYGALTASAGGERDLTSRLMHLIAALLLAGAWSLGHRSGVGWAAMVVAAAMEVGLGARSRAIEQKLAAEQAARDAIEAGASSASITTPAPPDKDGPSNRAAIADVRAATARERIPDSPVLPPPPFVTVVLLREPHHVTGDVLVASLRRAGRRDARLVAASEAANALGGSRVRIGDVELELIGPAAPLGAADLAHAAAQSFDWPEALEACREHAGCARIVTRASAQSPRSQVIAMHQQAHAAIAEFAPVCGALWEAAQLLRPVAVQQRRNQPDVDQTASAAQESEPARAESASLSMADTATSAAARAAMETCVNFRVTPIEPDESGTPRCVSDTVGLCAFGLPDIEIITPGEPDDRTSAVLYHLAEEFFTHGCNWPDGAEREVPPHGRWRASRRHATLPPGRPVMALYALS